MLPMGREQMWRLEAVSTSGNFGSQSILISFYCRQEVGALWQLEFADHVYAMFNSKSEGSLQKHQLLCHECMFYLLRLSSYGIFRKNINDLLDSGQLGLRFFLSRDLLTQVLFLSYGRLWQIHLYLWNKFSGLFDRLTAFHHWKKVNRKYQGNEREIPIKE